MRIQAHEFGQKCMAGHASGLSGAVHRAGGGGGDGFVGQLLETQRGSCTPSHEGCCPHLCGHQQTETRRCQEDSDGVVGMRLMGSPCLEAGAPSLGKVRIGRRPLQAGGQFLGGLRGFRGRRHCCLFLILRANQAGKWGPLALGSEGELLLRWGRGAPWRSAICPVHF